MIINPLATYASDVVNNNKVSRGEMNLTCSTTSVTLSVCKDANVFPLVLVESLGNVV